MWFHSKGRIFLYIIVFSSPAVVRILVRRLDSCFLTHIKKYMIPIHALIFEKHVKMCFILDRLKSHINLLYFGEVHMQQKKLAGRSFFSKLGLTGSEAHEPRWEFEGSAVKPFFHILLRLNGL